MSSLVLNIPDDLDKELENLNVKKEEFLLSALKEKINLQKANKLETALMEGYRSNHKENQQLVKEFSAADLENWYDY